MTPITLPFPNLAVLLAGLALAASPHVRHLPVWVTGAAAILFAWRFTIAWKAVARGETLLTKVFTGRASMEMWFDWKDLPPGLDTEARLSRLARWVLLAHASGLRYGVKLPGVELPLGSSDEHERACLRELALYDTDHAAVP